MSHSYDNTLLQRMGFSDPDRGTPAHDDACVQVAMNPDRFLRAVPVNDRIGTRSVQCELEIPLQKGDGKYATTVGFIDAMLTWEEAVADIGFHCSHQGLCRACNQSVFGPPPLFWESSAMLVEVKTRIDSIGNLLRQMNLYREYKKDHFFSRNGINCLARRISTYVIWSLCPDDAQYTQLLKQQGYTLIVGGTF